MGNGFSFLKKCNCKCVASESTDLELFLCLCTAERVSKVQPLLSIDRLRSPSLRHGGAPLLPCALCTVWHGDLKPTAASHPCRLLACPIKRRTVRFALLMLCVWARRLALVEDAGRCYGSVTLPYHKQQMS